MKKVWLSTEPDTRAEKFYREREWKEIGIHGKNEIKFEMTYRDWMQKTVIKEKLH